MNALKEAILAQTAFKCVDRTEKQWGVKVFDLIVRKENSHGKILRDVSKGQIPVFCDKAVNLIACAQDHLSFSSSAVSYTLNSDDLYTSAMC